MKKLALVIMSMLLILASVAQATIWATSNREGELYNFDDNGRLDVLFTEQNLKISSSEITDIPYLVSTEVQVRRWW